MRFWLFFMVVAPYGPKVWQIRLVSGVTMSTFSSLHLALVKSTVCSVFSGCEGAAWRSCNYHSFTISLHGLPSISQVSKSN